MKGLAMMLARQKNSVLTSTRALLASINTRLVRKKSKVGRERAEVSMFLGTSVLPKLCMRKKIVR